jgi:hypothetical protein
MPPEVKRRFWLRIRRPFRWFRIALLILALIVLGCLIRFDTVGLPDFVKARLIAELRAQGLHIKFEALYLKWFRGLVANSVVAAGLESTGSAEFVAREIVLKPDWAALMHLRFDIRSLLVRDGKLTIDVSPANGSSNLFVVDHIQTQLRLLPGDRWELDRFDASSLGARLNLQATLTNASAAQNWWTPSPTTQGPAAWREILRETVRVAEQMQFSQPPQARLLIHGDAVDPASISADLIVDAHHADTSWGRFTDLLLTARVNRQPHTNNEVRSELELIVDGIQLPWLGADSSRLHVDWVRSPTNPIPTDMKWHWELFEVTTPWGQIPDARFTGHTTRSADDPVRLTTDLSLESGSLQSQWVQFETNRFNLRAIHASDSLVPLEANWDWTATTPTSRWGNAHAFELSGRMTRSLTNTTAVASSDWAWWSLLQPYAISWSASLKDANLVDLPLDEVSVSGQWIAPTVTVEKLRASHNAQTLSGSADLDVATRRLRADFDSDLDLRPLVTRIEPPIKEVAGLIRWTTPPRVASHLECTMPAWTNSTPDLRTETLPTLAITGGVDAGNIGFREFTIQSLHSTFAYSNDVIRLPELAVIRPEGRADAEFTLNLADQRFHSVVRCGIDPLALVSLFQPSNTPASDVIRFSRPPQLEGEIWGRVTEPGETRVVTNIRAPGVGIRDQAFDEVSGHFEYFNRFIFATNVTVRAGNETASGPELGFDLASTVLYFTNTVGTMDAQRVFRSINPDLATNMSRYTFKNPPQARVNGWIEVRQGRQSDLRVDLSGGPFSYWKFNVPQISGTVAFVNEHVAITNLAAEFYGGSLTGEITVASTATLEPDFRFALEARDTDLHELMNDVWTPTNRLEGTLTGELTITSANAGDWGSWSGYGNVRLRDGYLWDIPLFGIFSPVFNAILPGLGQSRVSGGTATYFITNSVIHTRDLEIRSPAMRLAYKGTIDFDYNVNSRVEARLLRDMWVVGPLVSLVFSPITKMLEYKVTGTLGEPKLEPLLIPKALQFPLHPWRTIRGLFSDDKPPKQPEEKKTPP